MKSGGAFTYLFMRWLLGLALGFYFRRIGHFHPERVPPNGPVLFTANHPNSVTDPFVIGASVPRKVSFVATVQLFRLAPVKWLLTQCGVIPINRLKDDSKGMRSVLNTFEAVFRVLERGEAVAIFPEGITHDDPQLKEVKTGAARMALELEHRHGGKLGLKIVPVGLHFSAKEVYRSDVLVHFGEPILASEFLSGYDERRKECINRLTTELERQIQALILHVPQLEHARVIAAVKRLYLDKLRVGNRTVREPLSAQAEELILSQRIAAAVEHVYRKEPERAERFGTKLHRYERWLARLQLSDEAMLQFPDPGRLVRQCFGWAAIAVLGFPVALYGWLFRLLPALVVDWAVGKFANPNVHKAQISTASIVAGVVAFGGFYAICAATCHWLFGWPTSLWFALSLPVASLIAYYYWREIRKFAAAVRSAAVFLRAPFAAKRLAAMRAGLVLDIETAHKNLSAQTGVSAS